MDNKKRGFLQPAFLLAHVGAHAASKFAERLEVLGLTPPDAGILRFLQTTTGISQQELSGKLGIHPSRLVAVLDRLEEKALVERRGNEDDRRQYSLRLTDAGAQAVEDLGQVARQHQDALLAALSREEREILAELLTKI